MVQDGAAGLRRRTCAVQSGPADDFHPTTAAAHVHYLVQNHVIQAGLLTAALAGQLTATRPPSKEILGRRRFQASPAPGRGIHSPACRPLPLHP